MNIFEDFITGYAGIITNSSNKQGSAFIQYCKALSSFIPDSFYVWDIVQKQFCYIKSDDLFLCGHSVEEAMAQGYDFYSQIIYPEDLTLWTNILKVVQLHLKDLEEGRDEIDYFSCTFRLQRKYPSMSHPLPQMIYIRLKPLWVDDEVCYLICAMRSSTIKDVGNLRLHKLGQICEAYKFTTRHWYSVTPQVLTERETAILMLAGQGKNSREIADTLCKGQNTIQNQIKALFVKLEVHSMQEALEIASHYCISHPIPDTLEQSEIEAHEKKQRLFIRDKLQDIQEYLNMNKSIRYIAKIVGVAESTIRHWINKGILRKK